MPHPWVLILQHVHQVQDGLIPRQQHGARLRVQHAAREHCRHLHGMVQPSCLESLPG
jgi:hypothetical protein